MFASASNIDTQWSSPSSFPFSHKKHTSLSSACRLQRGLSSLSSKLSSLFFFALVSLQSSNFARQDLCHDARWNVKFFAVSLHPNLTINGRASMFLNSSTFFRNAVYASDLLPAFCTGFSKGHFKTSQVFFWHITQRLQSISMLCCHMLQMHGNCNTNVVLVNVI